MLAKVAVAGSAMCLIALGLWVVPLRQLNSLPASRPSTQRVSLSSQLRRLPDRSRIQITVGDRELEVEVVHTAVSITQGLSGRSEIGSDGMLFAMPASQRHTFWMKDMQFDLDMVWIDDGEVVDITRDVPKPSPGQQLQDLSVYSPSHPANAVLELPAGRADGLGIEVGSAVVLR